MPIGRQNFDSSNKNDYYSGIGVQNSNIASVQTGDSQYDALYAANPYKNLTYNRSGWQALLSSLGFRTDYDRFIEEQQVNANEYDAQVAQMKMQNEYNSPDAQVARMRAAGQNPDLLGTSGVEGAASPVQDVNGMSPGSSDEGTVTSLLWNFGTSVLNMCQVGFGLAKDMQTFKQMQQGVANGDVDLAKSFMDFANDFVVKSAPVETFDNDREYRDYIDRVGFDLVFDVPNRLHLNRRQRKIWSSVVSPTYFNSESFKNITSNWKHSRENLDNIAKTKSYSVSRNLFNQDNWRAFNEVANELGDLSNEVWKITQKRFKAVANKDISGAGAEKQIYDAQLDFSDNSTGLNYGQTKALAEGTGNMMDFYTRSVQKAMNHSLERITTRLENDANDGDLLSAGLLLAFNIFRLSNFKF